tara:strand:+ start:6736 stop:7074 length:339 start_codon:yes stop_codon:yes gene_type:complete
MQNNSKQAALTLYISCTTKKEKPMFKKTLGLMVAVSLACISSAVSAATDLPPLDISQAPEWLGYAIAILYGFSHVVAVLPASIKSKLPSWFLNLIDLVAANYGSAKNKDPGK